MKLLALLLYNFVKVSPLSEVFNFVGVSYCLSLTARDNSTAHTKLNKKCGQRPQDTRAKAEPLHSRICFSKEGQTFFVCYFFAYNTLHNRINYASANVATFVLSLNGLRSSISQLFFKILEPNLKLS